MTCFLLRHPRESGDPVKKSSACSPYEVQRNTGIEPKEGHGIPGGASLVRATGFDLEQHVIPRESGDPVKSSACSPYEVQRNTGLSLIVSFQGADDFFQHKPMKTGNRRFAARVSKISMQTRYVNHHGNIARS